MPPDSKIISRTIASLGLLTVIFFAPGFLYPDEKKDVIGKQKEFVLELFSSGRYFDCIAETRRLSIMDPSGGDAAEYDYFINVNYFLGGQYKSVINNLQSGGIQSADFRETILLSRAYCMLHFDSRAYERLMSIDYRLSYGVYNRELFLRRLEMLIRDSRYEEALKESEIAREYLEDVLDFDLIINDLKECESVDRRSPLLSAALSAAIPGAGQMYSGRYTDGLVSLIAIGATACGSYFFHARGDRPLSLTLGFFSALFYAGNIYGAWNSAETATDESERNFREKFSAKHIPDYSPSLYIDYTRLF